MFNFYRSDLVYWRLFWENQLSNHFKMAELNELLFNSDSDDEQFIGFEAKYIIK